MKKIVLLFCSLIFVFATQAQDELINKLENNKTKKAGFTFTDVKDIENTSVKNQGRSGTCWSYSANSLFESEMLRSGKTPIDLSEIFNARNVYFEKANQYILWQGNINLGDGGELHDVTNMYKKYGAIPQELYTGNEYGHNAEINAKLQPAIKQVLDSFLDKYKGKKELLQWKASINHLLDSFLGPVPASFDYMGKTYTPQSFAQEVVGLNADDFIELSSYKDYPYYKKFVFPVPDNWSMDLLYNVPMNDLTKIVDYALNKGITVGWATDVSEPYFSWRNGVAYVPDVDLEDLNGKDIKNIFKNPMAEKTITEEMRQDALNDLQTTDDHGMQIVGLAKDQNGKEYYKVKNSWGSTNDFNGYLYVSKEFLKYKTTAILLHKDGIPDDIRGECGIK